MLHEFHELYKILNKVNMNIIKILRIKPAICRFNFNIQISRQKINPNHWKLISSTILTDDFGQQFKDNKPKTIGKSNSTVFSESEIILINKSKKLQQIIPYIRMMGTKNLLWNQDYSLILKKLVQPHFISVEDMIKYYDDVKYIIFVASKKFPLAYYDIDTLFDFLAILIKKKQAQMRMISFYKQEQLFTSNSQQYGKVGRYINTLQINLNQKLNMVTNIVPFFNQIHILRGFYPSQVGYIYKYQVIYGCTNLKMKTQMDRYFLILFNYLVSLAEDPKYGRQSRQFKKIKKELIQQSYLIIDAQMSSQYSFHFKSLRYLSNLDNIQIFFQYIWKQQILQGLPYTPKTKITDVSTLHEFPYLYLIQLWLFKIKHYKFYQIKNNKIKVNYIKMIKWMNQIILDLFKKLHKQEQQTIDFVYTRVCEGIYYFHTLEKINLFDAQSINNLLIDRFFTLVSNQTNLKDKNKLRYKSIMSLLRIVYINIERLNVQQRSIFINALKNIIFYIRRKKDMFDDQGFLLKQVQQLLFIPFTTVYYSQYKNPRKNQFSANQWIQIFHSWVKKPINNNFNWVPCFAFAHILRQNNLLTKFKKQIDEIVSLLEIKIQKMNNKTVQSTIFQFQTQDMGRNSFKHESTINKLFRDENQQYVCEVVKYYGILKMFDCKHALQKELVPFFENSLQYLFSKIINAIFISTNCILQIDLIQQIISNKITLYSLRKLHNRVSVVKQHILLCFLKWKVLNKPEGKQDLIKLLQNPLIHSLQIQGVLFDQKTFPILNNKDDINFLLFQTSKINKCHQRQFQLMTIFGDCDINKQLMIRVKNQNEQKQNLIYHAEFHQKIYQFIRQNKIQTKNTWKLSLFMYMDCFIRMISIGQIKIFREHQKLVRKNIKIFLEFLSIQKKNLPWNFIGIVYNINSLMLNENSHRFSTLEDLKNLLAKLCNQYFFQPKFLVILYNFAKKQLGNKLHNFQRCKNDFQFFSTQDQLRPQFKYVKQFHVFFLYIAQSLINLGEKTILEFDIKLSQIQLDSPENVATILKHPFNEYQERYQQVCSYLQHFFDEFADRREVVFFINQFTPFNLLTPISFKTKQNFQHYLKTYQGLKNIYQEALKRSLFSELDRKNITLKFQLLDQINNRISLNCNNNDYYIYYDKHITQNEESKQTIILNHHLNNQFQAKPYNEQIAYQEEEEEVIGYEGVEQINQYTEQQDDNKNKSTFQSQIKDIHLNKKLFSSSPKLIDASKKKNFQQFIKTKKNN